MIVICTHCLREEDIEDRHATDFEAWFCSIHCWEMWIEADPYRRG